MKHPLWENIFRSSKKESETVLALKSVPIFEELDSSELREIEKLVYKRTYTRGEPIFLQGQPGLGMYIILSGRVTILRENSKGENQELASLEPGAFFGDMSLLNDMPRSAMARSDELSQVIAFFRTDLMDLLTRQPKTGIKVISGVANVIAERLRAQNEVSQELQDRISDLEREVEELKAGQITPPPS